MSVLKPATAPTPADTFNRQADSSSLLSMLKAAPTTSPPGKIERVSPTDAPPPAATAAPSSARESRWQRNQPGASSSAAARTFTHSQAPVAPDAALGLGELQRRVVDLIRPHGLAGISLAQLDIDYHRTHGRHPPQPISSLLPPKGFLAGVRYARIEGCYMVFTFLQSLADGVEHKLTKEQARATTATYQQQTAQAASYQQNAHPSSAPTVRVRGGGPTQSHAHTHAAAAASGPPREEELGEPLSGQLCMPGATRPFDIQLTGLTIRNAHALSLLIQSSLRAVICKDRKAHRLRRPSGSSGSSGSPRQPQAAHAEHLVMLNASLLMQPKDGCALWYTSGKSLDVVDPVEHLNPTWAGSNIECENLEGHSLLTFNDKNKAKWDANVKGLWVLLSLPGRRLVTLKNGRLLLLGGFLKAQMHIGASNGPWHLSGARARETEVLKEALGCCRRAGILPPLDRADQSLYVEGAGDKRGPVMARKGGDVKATPGGGGTKAGSCFAGLADDDSSDEDD